MCRFKCAAVSHGNSQWPHVKLVLGMLQVLEQGSSLLETPECPLMFAGGHGMGHQCQDILPHLQRKICSAKTFHGFTYRPVGYFEQWRGRTRLRPLPRPFMTT